MSEIEVYKVNVTIKYGIKIPMEKTRVIRLRLEFHWEMYIVDIVTHRSNVPVIN